MSDPVLLGGLVGLGWGVWGASFPPTFTQILSSPVCGLYFLASQSGATLLFGTSGQVLWEKCVGFQESGPLSKSTSVTSWASPTKALFLCMMVLGLEVF